MKMNSRLKKISKTRKNFKNATNNINFTPLRYFFPRQKQDLVAIVKEAEANNYQVRAVGSRHSFSEVQKCEDFLVSTDKLKGWEKVNPDVLHKADKNKLLIRVGAGVKLRALNKYLAKAGLALPNMGTIDVQSIAGALSTATHGTGITRPSFPDMIRSIGIVSAGGKMRQLELKSGISDPAKFDLPDVELIQNDDLFYSALVSFGSMGIIYEVIIEVVPAFWMKESRILTNWKILKEELSEGRFITDKLRNFDFVSLRISPYNVEGQYLASIVLQEILPEKPKRSLNARFRNLGSAILGRIPILPPWLLTRYMNLFPRKTPKIINNLLKGTRDKIFIAPSHKVLFQTAVNLRPFGISTEFSFPLDEKIMIRQVESVLQIAEDFYKEGKIYQSSFISLRFAPASNAYFSTSYNKESFYIEIPMLKSTKGDFEILSKYQDHFLSEGGLPHWGKVNDRLYADPTFLTAAYPKLDAWLGAKHFLDPNHTFTNSFLEKTNLLPAVD
jgi:hypothetical protein